MIIDFCPLVPVPLFFFKYTAAPPFKTKTAPSSVTTPVVWKHCCMSKPETTSPIGTGSTTERPRGEHFFCFHNTFALFKAHISSLNDWIECPLFSGDFVFFRYFFSSSNNMKNLQWTNNQHTHVTTPSHQAGKATSGDPTQPNFGQYAIDKNAAMATKLSNEDFDIVVRWWSMFETYWWKLPDFDLSCSW